MVVSSVALSALYCTAGGVYRPLRGVVRPRAGCFEFLRGQEAHS